MAHSASNYDITANKSGSWNPPDIESYSGRTFDGFHRADGRVGTRNYWLVFPLVFCENRNIKVIEEALQEQLGYATDRHFSVDTQQLIDAYQSGASIETLLAKDIVKDAQAIQQQRLFKNVDGIKFLTHQGGCGGTRQDAQTLCNLLAGYVAHPNVAGATVLSLGCQNAQFALLKQAIRRLNPTFNKPICFLEQQQSESERTFIAEAVSIPLPVV